MQTIITSNGSKWAGEIPDDLPKLLETLSDYPLDRTFEEYGNFVYDVDEIRGPGFIRFWGNFFSYSHVFSIDTDDPEVIKTLTTAIRKNQQRPDYLSQETPEQKRERRFGEEQSRQAARQEERERRARAVLGIPEPSISSKSSV